MAEHSKFFDSLNPLDPDKIYTAEEFIGYFEKLITTGVMKGENNMLKVETSGSNMNTTVDTGAAYLNGRLYDNDAKLSLTHEVEALGKSRIDRVVIRLMLNVDYRYIKAFVKKGVAGAVPIAPPLERTDEVYEISLAQVKVIGGQTYINVVDIVDERGKVDICPWAGSKILPNFNDDALADLISDVAGKADKDIRPIIEIPLINGWAHDATYPLKVYRDDFGRVHLNGRIRRSSPSTLDPFVLPVGFRAKGNRIFVASSIENSTSALSLNQLEVGATGGVYIAKSSINLLFECSFQIEN